MCHCSPKKSQSKSAEAAVPARDDDDGDVNEKTVASPRAYLPTLPSLCSSRRISIFFGRGGGGVGGPSNVPFARPTSTESLKSARSSSHFVSPFPPLIISACYSRWLRGSYSRGATGRGLEWNWQRSPERKVREKDGGEYDLYRSREYVQERIGIAERRSFAELPPTRVHTLTRAASAKWFLYLS